MTPLNMYEIRAVVFDAVGTLIHPEPSAATVYAEAGRQFGSVLPEAEIAARFTAAFLRQEEIDFAAGLRTDEGRELARWRAIVSEVLDDVIDREACFRHLFEHFSRATAWRTDPHAAKTLSRLAAQGYRLGIASNFDRRLRGVLADGELRHLPVVISSEIGWRKPAAGFYSAVCHAVGSEPHEILYVGDDFRNDFQGARNAGCRAVLFDPRDRQPAVLPRAKSLTQFQSVQPPGSPSSTSITQVL